MRFITLASLFSLGLAALAQDNSTTQKVEAITYPVMARRVGIEGDVRLRFGLSDNDVKVVSGHPILVAVAVDNLKNIGRASELGIFSDAEHEVVYHFTLIKPEIRKTKVTIQRGDDAFDRFILRILRMKTEKTVMRYDCFASPDPPKNRIDLTKYPEPFEIWVYALYECLTLIE